jgi:cell fate (sporulation/competence/biofilm development) regulator YmcA (YheA/YmcA/DUF963 family)
MNKTTEKQERVFKIQEEVEKLNREMWDEISSLPNISFETTDKQLDAVIKVGKTAEAIKSLRRAASLLQQR